MVNYTQSKIKNIVVHQVGAKAMDEPVIFSEVPLELDHTSPIPEVLMQYFMGAFKTDAYFNFTDEGDLLNNTVFALASEIFEDNDHFMEHSKTLAEHLYEKSDHPRIKSGEFYVVLFDNVKVGESETQCLGIFKSENKETYLKVFPNGNSFEINCEQGINIKRLDKGCLIFNIEKENGFLVNLVDRVSSTGEARFWKDDFLGVIPRQDNFYYTQNYLNLCKDFVTDVFNEENNVPRTEQIDLLNKSYSYFKENDSFNEEDFSEKVISEPDVVEAFNEYKDYYQNEKMVPLDEEFNIQQNAVKKQATKFKSVLKLDKNFHVYVHGERDLMERGFDPARGLNYYTFFFENEA